MNKSSITGYNVTVRGWKIFQMGRDISIELTSATQDSIIYYTLNESTPTTGSTKNKMALKFLSVL